MGTAGCSKGTANCSFQGTRRLYITEMRAMLGPPLRPSPMQRLKKLFLCRQRHSRAAALATFCCPCRVSGHHHQSSRATSAPFPYPGPCTLLFCRFSLLLGSQSCTVHPQIQGLSMSCGPFPPRGRKGCPAALWLTKQPGVPLSAVLGGDAVWVLQCRRQHPRLTSGPSYSSASSSSPFPMAALTLGPRFLAPPPRPGPPPRPPPLVLGPAQPRRVASGCAMP